MCDPLANIPVENTAMNTTGIPAESMKKDLESEMTPVACDKDTSAKPDDIHIHQSALDSASIEKVTVSGQSSSSLPDAPLSPNVSLTQSKPESPRQADDVKPTAQFRFDDDQLQQKNGKDSHR